MKTDDIIDTITALNINHSTKTRIAFDELLKRFFEANPEVTALGFQPEDGEYRMSFLDGLEIYVSKYPFEEGEDENFSVEPCTDERFYQEHDNSLSSVGSLVSLHFSHAFDRWYEDSSVTFFRNGTQVIVPRT